MHTQVLRRHRLPLVGMFVIAGCKPGHENTVPPDPIARSDAQPTTDIEPALAMIGPDRGSFVDRGTIVVSGHVHDDGPVKVTVSGVAATVADDTFTATLTVASGLTIIETHAIDTTGHDVRDVRSVLAGPFAPSNGSVPAAVGVRLGRDAIAALGKALATSARSTDFSAAARSLNPVYDNGGCLGAKADIATISTGNIDVTLVPKAGAIDTTVVVEDILVGLGVDYEVACIGGHTSMTVRTKARIHGNLGARLAGGRIQTALPDPAVSLEEFQIDIGGMPRPIEGLIRGRLREGVEKAVTKALATKLPALADAAMADVLAKPLASTLLGRTAKIEFVPRKVELLSSGLFVVTDTTLVVKGGEAGKYVTTPAAITSITNTGATDSIGVTIAADVLDQLFAGLWAAKAFDRTVPIDAVGSLSMLLDDDVRTLSITFSLPPTVTADKTVDLAIGDVIITARDGAGAEVQRFAVSLRTTLTVKPGSLALVTTAPIVHAQVLAQSAAVERPLDAAGVEGVVKGVWMLVDGMINDALAGVPIPTVTGVAFATRGLSAQTGVIVLDLAAKPIK